MKSATLQVVFEKGWRVCILPLSAFALLHSSFVLLNLKINCHVAEVFQMKSETLQVVFEEGCRVCILLWVPLHCCILLLSCNIAIGFAIWRKYFRWRVQHCRMSLRKDAGFAFFFWVCLHCCILLFLPDATPCASFFNRGSHSKPAEKRKTSTQKFTVWEWRLATLRSVIWKGCRICILPWVTLYCCILSFLPRQFARKCPVSHSFAEGRHLPVWLKSGL